MADPTKLSVLIETIYSATGVRLAEADLRKLINASRESGQAVGQAGSSADASGAKLESLGAKALTLAKNLGALVGLRQLFAAGKGALLDFAAAESSLLALNSTLDIFGFKTAATQQRVTGLRAEMKTLNFTGTETYDSFKQLVLVTGNLELSQAAMGAAAQLAKSQNLSLQEATSQLMMVYNGIIPRGGVLRALLGEMKGEMDRGVPSVANLARAVELLSGKLPAASANLNSTTERVRALANAWEDFKQSAGGFVAQIFDFKGMAKDLDLAGLAVRSLTGGLDDQQKMLMRVYDLNQLLDSLRSGGPSTWLVSDEELNQRIVALETVRLHLIERIKAARGESPVPAAAAAGQPAAKFETGDAATKSATFEAEITADKAVLDRRDAERAKAIEDLRLKEEQAPDDATRKQARDARRKAELDAEKAHIGELTAIREKELAAITAKHQEAVKSREAAARKDYDAAVKAEREAEAQRTAIAAGGNKDRTDSDRRLSEQKRRDLKEDADESRKDQQAAQQSIAQDEKKSIAERVAALLKLNELKKRGLSKGEAALADVETQKQIDALQKPKADTKGGRAGEKIDIQSDSLARIGLMVGGTSPLAHDNSGKRTADALERIEREGLKVRRDGRGDPVARMN